MDDYLKILLGVFGVLVLVVWLMMQLSFWVNRNTCEKKYSNWENRWSVWEDCQIKVNGKWIPADSYYIKEDVK